MTEVGPQAFTGEPRRLDPRARLMWGITPAVVFAAMAVVGAVVAVVLGAAVWALVAVAAGAVLALGSLVWARLEWSRWSWAVSDDAVELRHGVVTRHQSLVPFHRIQQIDVHRDPVERMLGLSALVLRTAAATSDAKIPGLAAEEVEAMRIELLRRSGIDDAV